MYIYGFLVYIPAAGQYVGYNRLFDRCELISSRRRSNHVAYIHAQCPRRPPTHQIILLPPPPAPCIYAQSIVAALPPDESTSCPPPHPIPSQFTPRRPPPSRHSHGTTCIHAWSKSRTPRAAPTRRFQAFPMRHCQRRRRIRQ
jgi:hypothetical protein